MMSCKIFLIFFVLFAIDQQQLQPILKQATELNENGELARAVEKYREALTILKEQNDTKGFADVSFKLGVALRDLGKFKEAEKALQEALQTHEEIGEELAKGFDLAALAVTHTYISKYDEGITLAKRAEEIFQNAQNKRGLINSFIALGRCYWKKTEYEKASNYANLALTISTEINDKDGLAQSLNLLGAINWEKGNFDRALEYYRQALPIAQEFTNKFRLATVVANMALVYWNQGDLDQALEYLKQALDLDRKIGNINKVAHDLYNIAAIESERGNYEKNYENLLEAMKLVNQLNDKDLLSHCLYSLGLHEIDTGNYDSAEEYFTKASQLAEVLGNRRTLGYSLTNIGRIHSKRGNYAGYLKYNEKALKIFEEIGEKRGVTAALSNVGEAYLKLRNPDQSLKFFGMALSSAQSIGSKFEQAISYLGIGSALRMKGKMNDAVENLLLSIQLEKEIQSKYHLWQSLYQIGLVSRDMGKDEQALQFLKQAVDVIEMERAKFELAEEKSGYLVQKLDVYDDLIHLLIATRNTSEAFEYVQRAKARSFLDTLAEAKIDPERKFDPAMQQEKNRISAELVKTETAIRNEYETDKIDQHKIQQLKTKRNELDTEYQNLVLRIRRQNPRFANVQYPQPLSSSDAQELLDDQSILLEYFLGKKHSLVFAITSTSIQVYELPNEQTLATQVNLIHEVLQKPAQKWETSEKAHTTYAGLASLLYQELMAPINEQLTGTPRIIIAPDGILNYLPFECLLSEKIKARPINFSKLPYLTRDHEIGYVPSASLLKALESFVHEQPSGGQHELIAFADPQYTLNRSGLTHTMVLAALPNSKIEVDRIRQLFAEKDAAVFFGKDANETNFKQMNLSDYRRIHFAGHSVIDEEKPQFSALLLSVEERSSEDGDLTMLEVFDLKLKADLVVLSSCRSALGKEVRGEGMTGLSRAFLSAGSASVVVSLWDVSDRSTADLMTNFYGYLAKGFSKAAALREARLQMIQTPNYSHPYYWAPFILIGES